MGVMYDKNGKPVMVSNSAETIWSNRGYTFQPNVAVVKANTPPTQTVSASPVSQPVQQPVQSNTVQVVQSAQDKRRAEVAKLSMSTIPEVAAIQRQSQDIYVQTGKCDDNLNKQAEAIRKGTNPMYPGGDRGFTDPQYFLSGAGSGTPSLDGFGSFFDSLLGLAGKGAAGAGDAANQATAPGNNGTVGLLLIGGVLLLLLGRR